MIAPDVPVKVFGLEVIVSDELSFSVFMLKVAVTLPAALKSQAIAGGDRLFHKSGDVVLVLRFRVGDLGGHFDTSASAEIDPVKPFGNRVCDEVLKRPAGGVLQRRLFEQAAPLQLERKPPLPVRQTSGWGSVDQLIPVEVPVIRPGDADDFSESGGVTLKFSEQFFYIGWYFRHFHTVIPS